LALLRAVKPSRLPERRANGYIRYTILHGSTSAILFYQSTRRHGRHLPTLRHGLALLRPSSSSTTYTHGGTLPPSHLAFHFPTTSRLPQALQRPPTLPPTSPTSAPSRFSLSNNVRSSSGTPTFNVHKKIAPTVPLVSGGRRRNLPHRRSALRLRWPEPHAWRWVKGARS